MAFTGNLNYVKISDGRYSLLEPLAYSNDKVKNDYAVVAQKGFQTDFASIPKAFFLLDPKNPKWAKAAVIHDKACKLVRDIGKLTYKEADNYLYYAMLDCGSSRFMAYSFWLWVSLKHKFD